MNDLPYRQAFDRIRAEYLEMPGMRLTPAQVQRLSGVDASICALVLDDLVRAQFLYKGRLDGIYARASDGGGHGRSRMARAEYIRQDVPMSSTTSTRRSRSDDEARVRARDTSSAAPVIARRLDESAPGPAESRMSRIARRAHEIYEARSGQHGTAMEDWLTAERQIDDEIDRARQSLE